MLYGFAIYLVMNWLVVPTRFGTEPSLDPWRVGNALFSHIVCVGLPIAWIAARAFRRTRLGVGLGGDAFSPLGVEPGLGLVDLRHLAIAQSVRPR